MANEYDVVVVGMGPVGSLAAILLAHRGLSVAVIDRDESVYQLPRAVNLDGEIVRALQPFGLAEDLANLLQDVREDERVGFANSRREVLFANRVRDFGVNGWQPMNFFDQPEVEGFLRTSAASHDNVATWLGYEAEGIVQDASSVRLDVHKGDERLRLEGRYLIAADGASSLTRRNLGIGWHDLGYNRDWLVVDIIALEGNTLGTTTLQVCDPDRISTYVCTKDPYRRWEFKLNDGETWEEMLEPDKIRSLIEAWTPPGTYEIRRAAMYTFHAATADTWRIDRIFLAGDAAHQTPPFLGQGMNTGLRDVINLAWKLPLVLSSTVADHLLDSYQVERQAHAHDLVDWAVSIGRLMEHLAENERAERAGEPTTPTPASLQSAGYGQGREQPPVRAGVLFEPQIIDAGAVGALFSQPIIATESGTPRRLDDLLGPGFAVVAREPRSLGLNDTSRRILERLDARLVDLSRYHAERGRFDRGFDQYDAMVIRPDRVVFVGSDANHRLDTVIAALANQLSLTAD